MGHRVWVDTEFNYPHLLSVGAVRDDGATFYAEMDGGNAQYANDFVVAHVLPQLHGKPSIGKMHLVCPMAGEEHACPLMSPIEMGENFAEFCGDAPEFWADYGAYDYVLLCELLGGMENWPEDWPMFFRDIAMWAAQLQSPPLPELLSNAHNALADAVQCRARWEFLANYQNALAQQVLKPQVSKGLARASGLVVPGGRA